MTLRADYINCTQSIFGVSNIQYIHIHVHAGWLYRYMYTLVHWCVCDVYTYLLCAGPACSRVSFKYNTVTLSESDTHIFSVQEPSGPKQM